MQQWLQPLGALRGAGKAVQQLDVAGVRGAAVEHLGRPGQAAHGFGQRRVVQIRQARAGFVIAQRGQEQVPQPFFARQGLEVFEERRRVVARLHGGMPGGVVGQHVAVDEGVEPVAHLPGQGRGVEVHAAIVKTAPARVRTQATPGLTQVTTGRRRALPAPKMLAFL